MSGQPDTVSAYYKRIRDGEYSLLEVIDYRLMENMPAQGTNMGGLYLIGATAKELGKKFDVPSSIVSSRLRLLKAADLIVDVHMIGKQGVRAWQVTPKGEEVFTEWKSSQ